MQLAHCTPIEKCFIGYINISTFSPVHFGNVPEGCRTALMRKAANHERTNPGH
jgi:hypothetical protein